MNSLANTFDFNSLPVRTFYKENQIWFAAVDVCRILEIENSRQAVETLDDDEKTENNTVSNTYGIQTAGSLSQQGNSQNFKTAGNPNLSLINESGLYSLVLRSRKPQAKAFKKWITAEVLPSIRKTGSYSTKRDMVEYSNALNIVENARCSEALKQLLLDKMGDELATAKALLSPAKEAMLIGVAQKAEQMGYTLTHSNRGVLGKFVKKMGLNPISEDRLVNGQLRQCLVYENNLALESAINEFFKPKPV